MSTSTLSRARKMGGYDSIPATVSIASGGTIAIPETAADVFVVGSGGAVTTSATAFSSPKIIPGRRVTIWGTDDTNTVTITHTAAASAASGTFTLNGNLALGNMDNVTIVQMNNGAWVSTANRANN